MAQVSAPHVPKHARKCKVGGHVADGASATGAGELRVKQQRGWTGRGKLKGGGI